MATPTISKDKRVLSMSRGAAPVARIQPGTTIHLQTADCFADQVQGPDDADRGLDWDSVNPATGPIYVEGAKPGDGQDGLADRSGENRRHLGAAGRRS